MSYALNLLKIADNDSTMVINYFKGDKGPSINIRVFLQGQKEAVVKIVINKFIADLATMMELNIVDLLSSTEAKNLVSTLSTYEKDPSGKGSYKLAGVLSISKNNEGTYSVGIKTQNYSHDYIISTPSGLSNSSSQMTMKDRSHIGIQTLLRKVRDIIPRLNRIEEEQAKNPTTFAGDNKKFDKPNTYQPSQKPQESFGEYSFN